MASELYEANTKHNFGCMENTLFGSLLLPELYKHLDSSKTYTRKKKRNSSRETNNLISVIQSKLERIQSTCYNSSENSKFHPIHTRSSSCQRVPPIIRAWGWGFNFNLTFQNIKYGKSTGTLEKREYLKLNLMSLFSWWGEKRRFEILMSSGEVGFYIVGV